MEILRFACFLIASLFIGAINASDFDTAEIDKQFSKLNKNITLIINPSGNCSENGRIDWLNKAFVRAQTAPNEVINSAGPHGQHSDPKFSTYESYVSGIETWSLYNIDDYQRIIELNEIERDLRLAFAGYYVNKFDYKAERATTLANKVVDSLLGKTLSAFNYAPITNPHVHQLKKLILEKGNIEDIRKFNDLSKLQNPFYEGRQIQGIKLIEGWHTYPSSTENESILSIAVDYPEALEHLLKLGVNPNHQNYFGKTPLMYAVQRNQLESVKLLLKFKANVDLATKKMHFGGPCAFYNLYQYDVTALHYAARFANSDVIKVLLSHNASLYANSNIRLEYENGIPKFKQGIPLGTPCQWYDFFGKEKNANSRALLCHYQQQ